MDSGKWSGVAEELGSLDSNTLGMSCQLICIRTRRFLRRRPTSRGRRQTFTPESQRGVWRPRSRDSLLLTRPLLTRPLGRSTRN